ncbi:MAG: DUF3391 domain-containing protein [Nitrospirota bacterium]
MAKEKETREKIPIDRLAKGLYVDLEMSWIQHPFIFSRFKIKSEKDIAAIRQLGLKEIIVIPERSDIRVPDVSPVKQSPEMGKSLDELWQNKKAHIESAKKYRDRRINVAEKYSRQAQTVRKIAQDLRSQPANAIQDADSVVEGLASDFEYQGDLLTNLVNLGIGRQNYYNHSVNVTVLSLMLGAAEELKADELRQIGVGALLHDIGKTEIPSRILGKTSYLTHVETQFLQRHTIIGYELAKRTQSVPRVALEL